MPPAEDPPATPDPTAEFTGEQSQSPAPEPLDPAHEKDLWHGRESWKSLYPPLVLWALVTIAALFGVGYFSDGWQPLYITFGVMVLLLLVLLVRTGYRILSTSYRITTQRLFLRRGIISQTVDQTELLRVDDVQMKRSLLDRLLGTGNVQVISSDRTDSDITIKGVEDPATVAEHIRRHTRSVQKRTLFMEQL